MTANESQMKPSRGSSWKLQDLARALRWTNNRLLSSYVLSLTILIIILCSSFQASEGASLSPIGKHKSSRDRGCYYMLQHYKNGQQIKTDEPCLNCTCENSMLMCYLRVCPYVKPVGDRCIIERVNGECCPRIICPETAPPPDSIEQEVEPETISPATATTPTSDSVPSTNTPTESRASTTTTTTTQNGLISSEVTFTNSSDNNAAGGCMLAGNYYHEGAQMPSDPSKPCEVCYCIRNSSACVMQECALEVSGCAPIYNAGGCCPTRYNCSAENAFTTPRPGFGSSSKRRFWESLPERFGFSTTEGIQNVKSPVSLSTTTASPLALPDFGRSPSSKGPGCKAPNSTRLFADGERVPSKNKCEHCYCMRSEIVCAVQECRPPCDGCVPIIDADDQCCPKRYECAAPTQRVPADNIIDTQEFSLSTTTGQQQQQPSTNATQVDLAPEVSTSAPGGTSDDSISSSSSTTTTPTSAEASKVAPSSTEIENSPQSTATTASAADLAKQEISVMTTRQTRPPLKPISPKLSTNEEEASSEMATTDDGSSPSGPKTEMKPANVDGFNLQDEREQEGESVKTGGRVEAPEGVVVGSGQATSDANEVVPPSLTSTVAPQVVTGPPSTTSTTLMSNEPAISSVASPTVGDSQNLVSNERKSRPLVVPSTVPGEGSCRYNGKIYDNGDEVKSRHNCSEICMCINSVVYCDEVDCPRGPDDQDKCQKVMVEGQCCPKYICPEEASSASPVSTSETRAQEATGTPALEASTTTTSKPVEPTSEPTAAPSTSEPGSSTAPSENIEISSSTTSSGPVGEPKLDETPPGVKAIDETTPKATTDTTTPPSTVIPSSDAPQPTEAISGQASVAPASEVTTSTSSDQTSSTSIKPETTRESTTTTTGPVVSAGQGEPVSGSSEPASTPSVVDTTISQDPAAVKSTTPDTIIMTNREEPAKPPTTVVGQHAVGAEDISTTSTQAPEVSSTPSPAPEQSSTTNSVDQTSASITTTFNDNANEIVSSAGSRVSPPIVEPTSASTSTPVEYSSMPISPQTTSEAPVSSAQTVAPEPAVSTTSNLRESSLDSSTDVPKAESIPTTLSPQRESNQPAEMVTSNQVSSEVPTTTFKPAVVATNPPEQPVDVIVSSMAPTEINEANNSVDTSSITTSSAPVVTDTTTMSPSSSPISAETVANSESGDRQTTTTTPKVEDLVSSTTKPEISTTSEVPISPTYLETSTPQTGNDRPVMTSRDDLTTPALAQSNQLPTEAKVETKPVDQAPNLVVDSQTSSTPMPASPVQTMSETAPINLSESSTTTQVPPEIAGGSRSSLDSAIGSAEAAPPPAPASEVPAPFSPSAETASSPVSPQIVTESSQSVPGESTSKSTIDDLQTASSPSSETITPVRSDEPASSPSSVDSTPAEATTVSVSVPSTSEPQSTSAPPVTSTQFLEPARASEAPLPITTTQQQSSTESPPTTATIVASSEQPVAPVSPDSRDSGTSTSNELPSDVIKTSVPGETSNASQSEVTTTPSSSSPEASTTIVVSDASTSAPRETESASSPSPSVAFDAKIEPTSVMTETSPTTTSATAPEVDVVSASTASPVEASTMETAAGDTKVVEQSGGVQGVSPSVPDVQESGSTQPPMAPDSAKIEPATVITEASTTTTSTSPPVNGVASSAGQPPAIMVPTNENLNVVDQSGRNQESSTPASVSSNVPEQTTVALPDSSTTSPSTSEIPVESTSSVQPASDVVVGQEASTTSTAKPIDSVVMMGREELTSSSAPESVNQIMDTSGSGAKSAPSSEMTTTPGYSTSPELASSVSPVASESTPQPPEAIKESSPSTESVSQTSPTKDLTSEDQLNSISPTTVSATVVPESSTTPGSALSPETKEMSSSTSTLAPIGESKVDQMTEATTMSATASETTPATPPTSTQFSEPPIESARSSTMSQEQSSTELPPTTSTSVAPSEQPTSSVVPSASAPGDGPISNELPSDVVKASAPGEVSMSRDETIATSSSPPIDKVSELSSSTPPEAGPESSPAPVSPVDTKIKPVNGVTGAVSSTSAPQIDVTVSSASQPVEVGTGTGADNVKSVEQFSGGQEASPASNAPDSNIVSQTTTVTPPETSPSAQQSNEVIVNQDTSSTTIRPIDDSLAVERQQSATSMAPDGVNQILDTSSSAAKSATSSEMPSTDPTPTAPPAIQDSSTNGPVSSGQLDSSPQPSQPVGDSTPAIEPVTQSSSSRDSSPEVQAITTTISPTPVSTIMSLINPPSVVSSESPTTTQSSDRQSSSSADVIPTQAPSIVADSSTSSSGSTTSPDGSIVTTGEEASRRVDSTDTIIGESSTPAEAVTTPVSVTPASELASTSALPVTSTQFLEPARASDAPLPITTTQQQSSTEPPPTTATIVASSEQPVAPVSPDSRHSGTSISNELPSDVIKTSAPGETSATSQSEVTTTPSPSSPEISTIAVMSDASTSAPRESESASSPSPSVAIDAKIEPTSVMTEASPTTTTTSTTAPQVDVVSASSAEPIELGAPSRPITDNNQPGKSASDLAPSTPSSVPGVSELTTVASLDSSTTSQSTTAAPVETTAGVQPAAGVVTDLETSTSTIKPIDNVVATGREESPDHSVSSGVNQVLDAPSSGSKSVAGSEPPDVPTTSSPAVIQETATSTPVGPALEPSSQPARPVEQPSISETSPGEQTITTTTSPVVIVTSPASSISSESAGTSQSADTQTPPSVDSSPAKTPSVGGGESTPSSVGASNADSLEKSAAQQPVGQNAASHSQGGASGPPASSSADSNEPNFSPVVTEQSIISSSPSELELGVNSNESQGGLSSVPDTTTISPIASNVTVSPGDAFIASVTTGKSVDFQPVNVTTVIPSIRGTAASITIPWNDISNNLTQHQGIPEGAAGTGGSRIAFTSSSTTQSLAPEPLSSTPSSASSTESDYEEITEDSGCEYENKTYSSAQQIPRSHPCDFCFCFRGDIICLQQTCPPPVPHCFETIIDGFCCPRYECPVHTVRASTNSTSLSLTPYETHSRLHTHTHEAEKLNTTKTASNIRGCFVDNKLYGVGQVIESASGPCLECRCDRSGMMKCNPKECTPEDPLLQQINREVLQSTLSRSQVR